MPVSPFHSPFCFGATTYLFKISDLLAQITGEAPSPPSNTNPSIQKRKADDDLFRPNEKTVKRETVIANSSRPIVQVKKSSAMNTSTASSRSTSSSKPLLAKTVPAGSIATTSAAPTVSHTTKPPKKGSYAEIMARGKAAQATLGQVGKIQHKRIEKAPNKRDRQDQKDPKDRKSQTARDTNGKPRPGAVPLKNGRSVPSEDNGRLSAKGPKEPEKKVKKAATATIGYTGTARPLPSATKSSKPSTSRYDSRLDRDRSSPSVHSRRYQYASDEEADEEEEDYDSDASSDMEAGMDEVDEEEERAARLARLEDAEALREENRLKKEKEERRKRLAAMSRR